MRSAFAAMGNKNLTSSHVSKPCKHVISHPWMTWDLLVSTMHICKSILLKEVRSVPGTEERSTGKLRLRFPGKREPGLLENQVVLDTHPDTDHTFYIQLPENLWWGRCTSVSLQMVRALSQADFFAKSPLLLLSISKLTCLDRMLNVLAQVKQGVGILS